MELIYGTGKHDYSEGMLICVAPGQLGGKEDNGDFVNLSGWAVLFHPDILQGTGLEMEIRNFSFFDYRINEALNMSAEERDVMALSFVSSIWSLKNRLRISFSSRSLIVIKNF
ncbi:MAG: hypothetical protein K2K92_07810 [Duncaniella sp.]|nr:hypothetical protein [Duncaniella sp.]